MDGRLGKSQSSNLDHGIESLRDAGLGIVLAPASVGAIWAKPSPKVCGAESILQMKILRLV
jgi:hypothetical protein